MSEITYSFLGAVGAQSPAEGATVQPRVDRLGALVTNPIGSFAECARRGQIYHGMTAVTGVAPGTSIGTTAAFALYNAAGTGKDLVILRATMGYVSGTLGIGRMDWVSHARGAATGTAIPAQPAIVGGSAAVGAPLTTATVITGGVPFRTFANLPPMLATSVLTPWNFVDDVDGAIVVPPGYAVSLQGTAGAGTSPLVVFGITWAEVPTIS